MARIAGVNIPTNKRVLIALQYIHGIGQKIAGEILEKVKIPEDRRVNQLSDAEVLQIREVIDRDYLVEGDLRREVGINIKRLMDLGCYRGLRHRRGLPVRGQRTHTNARTRKGPAKAIAGVNGGYDYRVDAWASRTPHDNICPPRYAKLEDPRGFYSQHPPATQCGMDAQGLPACASGASLPIADDLGDSLVLLSAAQRAKSWRGTPLQSYNCGGLGEVVQRGALILYRDDVLAARTSAGKDDLAELALNGKAAQSAIGAGPLLLADGAFVYDQAQSEEGMPLDNYEVGGATGAGYSRAADGTLTVHIVNIDGEDSAAGMNDWMLGLYFLRAPQAQSTGALALGNGGDATLWINPQAAAVQAALRDARNANHAYFENLFVHNSHPGIVSNCSGFGGILGCSARPVHDGLFVYAP